MLANLPLALGLTGLAGLATAVGGTLVLRPFLSDALLGWTFALTAGVMVFISLDQLLPAARSHDPGHLSLAGTLAGMGVMALSLTL